MIYRAYLNQQEITSFFLDGVETDEIWGGDVLLWKKSEEASNVFIFEWKDKIAFTLKGNGEVKIENSYGYSTTSPKSTRERKFEYQKSGVYKTKLTLQADVKFTLMFMNEKKEDSSTEYHYESSLTRILSAVPANIQRVTTNATFPFYTPDFSITGSITSAPYFYEIPEKVFKYHRDFATLDFAFYNCKSLKKIPPKLLQGMTKLQSVESMFRSTAITEIPENLFTDATKLHLVDWTFADTNITEIPANLFSTQKEPNTFAGCFNNTKITRVSAELFSWMGNIPGYVYPSKTVSLRETFGNCVDLQYADSNLLNFMLTNGLWFNAVNVNKIFSGCKKLINAPKLWIVSGGYQSTPHNSEGAYENCTSLPWYNEIPSSMK